MDYSPDTVFITGQARPAKEDAISLVHGVFYLGLIVDRKTGRIEDAQCNTILPMTDRFVHSLIVGKRLVEDMEELEKIIRSRYFARGKAAMAEITTCPTVAATATKRLLKAYRLKGTHSPDANLNSMEKLSSVGLRTKKRGGKI